MKTHWLTIGCRVTCIGFGLIAGCEEPAPPLPPPATQPTTTPATAPIEPEPVTYIDLAKKSYPKLPTTQPLSYSVNLDHAGHIKLSQPVYLCNRGDLWITHPDAPPTSDVIDEAADEQVHLIGERVLYVHWPPRRPRGKWRPVLFVASDAGAIEVIRPDGHREAIETHRYLWDRAAPWGDRIVVPTTDGLCLIAVGDTITINCHTFTIDGDSNAAHGGTRFTFDARGLIAWIPWDNGVSGSLGAVRYVNDTWIPLGPDEQWPAKLIHLVPLLDGSVLQVRRTDERTIEPALVTLEATPVDERKITELVEKLSDFDPAVRDQAYGELTQYGPGAWPVLERLLPEQPAEGQIRLEQILGNKLDPTLGPVKLIDGIVEVAGRLPDGGVLLFAKSGVEIVELNGSTTVVPNAWISIRPGGPIRLLDEDLAFDARPGRQTITAWGGDWMIWTEGAGWRRLMGNHLAPLLKDDERHYAHFAGIDRRGRWIFKPSADADEALILDPSIPDPTPRLPVWTLASGGEAGWDQEDWPALKAGGAWRLTDVQWEAMDEATNAFVTQHDVEQPEQSPPPASTQPLEGPPLLTTQDGTRYFGGTEDLIVVSPDGQQTVWPLPPAAVGSATPHLIHAGEDRLFLYNAPGRMLRIKPTPGEAEPFELEATFTRGLPNTKDVTRVWRDPAGRIVIAHGGAKLNILFPTGTVPPHIERMIPAGDLVE